MIFVRKQGPCGAAWPSAPESRKGGGEQIQVSQLVLFQLPLCTKDSRERVVPLQSCYWRECNIWQVVLIVEIKDTILRWGNSFWKSDFYVDKISNSTHLSLQLLTQHPCLVSPRFCLSEACGYQINSEGLATCQLSMVVLRKSRIWVFTQIWTCLGLSHQVPDHTCRIKNLLNE